MSVADPDTTKVTIREVADVIALVAIELVGALSRDGDQADARLEELAGRLIDYGHDLPKGNQRLIMAAIAETLIATEEGAAPSDED